MPAWLAVAAIAAVQGQAVVLEVADADSAIAVETLWQGERVPLARSDDRWIAMIGVDLDVEPAQYRLPIRFTRADGSVTETVETLQVDAGRYPETHLEVAQRYVTPDPEEQARAARDSRRIAQAYAVRSDEPDWMTPFAAPLAGATGGRNFGHRRFFNGQPRSPHSGADLRAAEGTPVLASNGGRVVLAEDLFFSGNAVFIDHGAGVISVYLHLSRIDVAVGDRIERGAPLGLSGATGRVTGPHLHWGIRVLDARVDPFTLPGMAAH